MFFNSDKMKLNEILDYIPLFGMGFRQQKFEKELRRVQKGSCSATERLVKSFDLRKQYFSGAYQIYQLSSTIVAGSGAFSLIYFLQSP